MQFLHFLAFTALFYASIQAQRDARTERAVKSSPLVLSPSPANPDPLRAPREFTLIQRNLLDACESYYAPMRRGHPHRACKPVSAARPHHHLCHPTHTHLLASTASDVTRVVDLLRTKYPNDGPEGGLSVTSYFPQPGFSEHGQMRFQDGVHDKALFWSLEHGEGCLEGRIDRWCVTVVVKAEDANSRMVKLVTTRPKPAKEVKKQEEQNLEMFERKVKREIKDREGKGGHTEGGVTEEGEMGEGREVESGPEEVLLFADEADQGRIVETEPKSKQPKRTKKADASADLHRRADFESEMYLEEEAKY